MSKGRCVIALGLAVALVGCDDDDSPSGASDGLSVACNATPTSGVVPLAVQFSATVSGADDDTTPSISWSFGDGSGASVATATRTYLAPGTYAATAEVRARGRTASCNVSVTARGLTPAALPPNRPPAAHFKTNPSPTAGRAPLTVDFNACQSVDPDGDPLLFRFDVFDGLYDSSHCRREHTYRTPGTYRAKVCVTDDFAGHEDICQSYTVSVQ